MYDILIKNGILYDGSGAEGYSAELAVKDGKIARIAPFIDGEAKTVIDAVGQVVTPGFIDSHSHSDNQFFTNPGQVEKVEQGITTAICGQCGSGICGSDPAGFLEKAKDATTGINMAMLVGHGDLRRAVMGIENRAPTPEELEQMKAMLRAGMEQGALGLSFGLIYVPGCYAKTEELIQMAKVVAEYDGIVAAHIRGEGDTLIEATEEFIQVLKASGAKGVHSHHKCLGEANRGKVNTTLKMLDDARAEGMELYADAYPYTASHTKFSNAFVPREWRAEGVDKLLEKIRQPENIQHMKKRYYAQHQNMHWVLLTRCPGEDGYVGLRMTEIAKLRNQDEFDAMLDIITLTRDQAKACFFSGWEPDVARVLSHPRVMVCTDAGTIGPNTTGYHPRLRGSFPRVLGRFVRQLQVTGLPEMIRKMTSLPAKVYGFDTKGLLKEGMDADICVFDPEKIIDRAEFTDPSLRAEGLSYVIVGGKIAAIDAVATGELGGKVMYRQIKI